MQEYQIKERTLDKLLEAKAKKNGDRPFIFFEDEIISFSQLNETANAVAAGLHSSSGIRKGDSVCIMLPNCLEFIYAWMGLVKLGALKVPINPAQKGELLAYFINQSGAKVIITESTMVDRLNYIAEKVPNLSTVILCGDESGETVQTNSTFKVFRFEKLYEGDSHFINSEPAHEYDPFCISYTSGTTGVSKGVLLPHNYAVYNATTIDYIAQLTENDTVYCCLPFFHGHAPLLSFLPSLIADARFVLGRRFSATTFWETIRKYKVTAFNALGGIIPILHKQEERSDDSDNAVRVCIGMAPENIWLEFEKRFGLTIIEAYGSTEASLLTYNTFSSRKPASIGKINPDFEVRLVDENDYEVPTGEVGEVISRPKIPWTMMIGYYKMPEKTAEISGNLWFHTGDYAFKDEDGFLFFVDRKKDCIRRKGENISSFEVEQVVDQHPAVLESAAIAVKSEIEDEEVKIVVALKPGQSLSPEELITFCDKNMAFYMIPRYVEFCDKLPKTPTEKIEKHVLKDQGVNAKTWDRIAAGFKLSTER